MKGKSLEHDVNYGKMKSERAFEFGRKAFTGLVAFMDSW